MDELERDGKRDRSKKMPKRRAQARVQEQLRAINPVLANPEDYMMVTREYLKPHGKPLAFYSELTLIIATR
ncbi:hypothetical protein SFE83_004787 [Salmonella enterica]|nr:hypothetical protein [Salmonella enterica]